MFFSYVGGALFLFLLIAAAGSSLHEILEGVKKQRKVPIGASLLLSIYALTLVAVFGFVWLMSTIEWD